MLHIANDPELESRFLLVFRTPKKATTLSTASRMQNEDRNAGLSTLG